MIQFITKYIITQYCSQRRARRKTYSYNKDANAQHNALTKAMKAKFKIENIYYVTFRLKLRHLQTKFKNISRLILI